MVAIGPSHIADIITILNLSRTMKAFLNWSAAAASLVGLFFTLHPISESLTAWQGIFVFLVLLVFGAAAFRDIADERSKAAKAYRDANEINNYMFSILQNSGYCEICSRNASWIADPRIFAMLKDKARRSELTFFVHVSTKEIAQLQALGAQVIEYGALGFDPMTRFTIVNAGNRPSSYVAIGRKKPNELHTIEELDSNHPTYSMALDLIGSIRTANDNFKKIQKFEANCTRMGQNCGS